MRVGVILLCLIALQFLNSVRLYKESIEIKELSAEVDSCVIHAQEQYAQTQELKRKFESIKQKYKP